MMIHVAPIISMAAVTDMAMVLIAIHAALMVSKGLCCAHVWTGVVKRSFCNFHVLRGILSNGDVFLDALVIQSKGDCDQDQEGQEKTCVTMKHVGEVDLLFRMI